MAEIKAPEPLKSEEKVLADAMESMVTMMSRMYKNQVILEMNKGTIEKFSDATRIDIHQAVLVERTIKFIDGYRDRTVYDYERDDDGYEQPVNPHVIQEPIFKYKDEELRVKAWDIHPDNDRLKIFTDAQTGNYGAILTKLAKKVSKKLLSRFDNKRIQELSRDVLAKNDRRSRKILYDRLSKDIGIDETTLMKRDGMTYDFNALVLETTQWAQKLRDETLEMYTANTLRAMTLGTPIDEILEQFDGMVEKRKNHARFTARNQVASFNSIMNKTRAQKLGITKAVWVTSFDERVRPSHDDRKNKEFDLSEGLYSSIDGKFLLPGVDFNCFAGELKINHASCCDKFFRRRYTGKLSSITTDDGSVISSTANHPILTTNGFKAAHLINTSDYIIKVVDDTDEIIKLYGKDIKPTFEQLFGAFNLLGVEHGVAPSVRGKFHGDVSDSEIDIVSMDSLLTSEVNTSVSEKFSKLNLSNPEKEIVLDFFTCIGEGLSGFNASGRSFNCVVSCIDLFRSGFIAHLTPLESFCFSLGAWYDASIKESISYSGTANAEMFSDSVFALSVLVHGCYIFDRKIDAFKSGRLNLGENKSKLLGAFSKVGWIHRDGDSGIFDEHAIKYKICSVTNNFIGDFSGHIYNLETISNDYIVEATAVSNCRCGYKMILDDEE